MPGCSFAGLPKTQPPDNSDSPTVEVWRIRIANYETGPIEVSMNGGASWSLVGRVSEPATQSLMGYLAAGYAPIGSVAATAVHGIRIRLGDTTSAYPLLINIVPREWKTTNDSFGGHVAGDSGIYTDIPSGASIFRDLAPYVGSPCYLVTKSGAMQRLTPSYVPAVGDTLVIVSQRLVNQVRSVVFDNSVGGNVTVTYADGTNKVITHVVKPVEGIGRFDGTSYTGVGAVNTNHTCVITISTAPVTDSTQFEGIGTERRGGFQIEPVYHNSQTEEAGAPQVMVVGTPHAQDPELEGRAPLFFGGIGLAWNSADPKHSWICDVQTKATGGTWQPMPQIIGVSVDDFIKRGITAFKLHRDDGDDDQTWLAKRISSDARDYQAMQALAAQTGAIPLVRGEYLAPSGFAGTLTTAVEFYVDGAFAAITNNQPYTFDWNSKDVTDGEHIIEARAEDSAGNIVAVTRKLVYVDNSDKGAKS